MAIEGPTAKGGDRERHEALGSLYCHLAPRWESKSLDSVLKVEHPLLIQSAQILPAVHSSLLLCNSEKSVLEGKKKLSIGQWVKCFCVFGVGSGEMVGAGLLSICTSIPPAPLSALTPTPSRTEARIPPSVPSAKPPILDSFFFFFSQLSYITPYRSTALEGGTTANFPTLNKLAPGVTLETPPMCYANFFSGGEQKLFFLSFLPLMERTKTPF